MDDSIITTSAGSGCAVVDGPATVSAIELFRGRIPDPARRRFWSAHPVLPQTTPSFCGCVVATIVHPLSKCNLTAAPKGEKLSWTDTIDELNIFFHFYPGLHLNEVLGYNQR